MRTLSLIPIVWMASALAFPARAQEVTGDVVFLAIPSRTGSISSAGATSAVHLRWDVTEGDLPADFTAFELYRGGALIATLPFDAPDPAVVEALYVDPDNARRFAEARTFGDELGYAMAEIDVDQVVEILVDRLQSDPFFAHYAARLDPVLAAARGLGFVDEGVSGTLEYRLDGVLAANASQPERRVTLGRTTVTTGTPWKAPAATGLRQIPPSELRRCDAPEDMKAHGVLALDWTDPGTGGPERLALSTSIVGWDVYRSAVPVAAVQLRDLAAEAALVAHGEGGAVELAGLVRVNDLPILGSAEPPASEPGYAGWAPAAARWMLPWAEVEALGMEAGQTYALYLVPRDLTGNWGATASALVTIPDLLAPPTPWGIHTTRRVALADRGGNVTPEVMVIRWPHVDLLNFTADHPRRTYCNLEDARFSRELAFTDEAACPAPDEASPTRVSLRVSHYDIYRFDSAAAAARFGDADGDGVANLDERVVLGDTPSTAPLTTPGLACDPTRAPVGADDHKVATVLASAATPGPSGRLRLEWSGVQDAEDAGRVFWYRVVAVAEGGARSPLSRPVRALFPAYRELPRLTIDPPERCDESIALSPCDDGALAGVDTTGDAAAVRYTCGPHTWTFPLSQGAGSHADDLVSRAWADLECGDHDGSLNNLCSNQHPLTVSFLDASGTVIASVGPSQFSDNTLCRCAELTEACVDPPPTTLPGSTEPVPYDPDAGECTSIYRRIGDRIQRVEVVCDELVTDFASYYDAGLLGGVVCLYQAIQGPNGALTQKLPLGCEDLGEAAAEVPEIGSLTFPGTTAEVGIIPPRQVVLGFVTELRSADGATRITTFVPSGPTDALGRVTKAIEIGLRPVTGTYDEWCFRARTVISRAAAATITDTLSDWSPELCAVRRGPNTPAPSYIPWPTTPEVPEDAPLDAIYLDGDGLPVVHLAAVSLADCGGPLSIPQCVGDPEAKGDEVDACYFPIVPLEASECQLGCHGIEQALRGRLGFVVYRQGRPTSDDPAGDFVQVSPLIDRAHCAQVTEDELPEGVQWNPLYGAKLDLLADPYIALADFSGEFDGVTGNPWSGEELFFVDRYPHTDGWEYRYQLVYFDARGEIVRTRTSNWMAAER